ncbi:MAG TPA: site-2 protease family protein [Candidatus Limnocylindria bacterium]|nr:site-2 protease family protein [Candidatus Limnocylindria bacterium]
MPGSFRVARLFGIELRIHVSWVVIFGLVFFNLWNDIFPSQYPFWSDQKTLLVSAITAVLFFCSIVAHELSHSLVARRFNMRVSSITLFLLGGVANLQQEPPSAKAEFFMASAGPFMSLCIGALGLGLQTLIDATDTVSLQTVAAVAGYLGFINVLLAGFNMIPGFPLDGGRVLRSIIWAVRRDRAKATGIAARGGQLVAGLFVLWALAQLSIDGARGLWWWPILIAYFLYNAATQSLRQERLGGLVAGTRVAPLMNTTFAVADPRSSVANVVRDLMLPRSLRAVPVVANQDFLGLMTSDDVRKIDHERWATTPVEQVMTRSADLPKLAPDDDLGQALERFGDGTVLPVVRDGRLVGLLDRDGVLNYIRMRDMFAQGR